MTEVRLLGRRALPDALDRLADYALRDRGGPVPLSRHPAWPLVLARGLGHEPYCVEAVRDGRTAGILPLAFVRSLLFGKFLVGLPYLNYGGVTADDDETAAALVDRAVALADDLGVRHLELRHEGTIEHPMLPEVNRGKVHMRLPLPGAAEMLWDGLSPKVRNQVRKGRKGGLTVAWGGVERLDEFHDVFSRNMRDLGTPVFSRRLFAAVLDQFPAEAELCVVLAGGRAVAAALLLHGRGTTEVPSAGALREFSPTCANMLMYWHLLERAVARGQSTFDFGRSSPDAGTYRFKAQWGAEPHPAAWQYRVRSGEAAAMRPDNPKYRRMIRIWRRLPVPLTRLIGPPIVRGIP